MIANRPAQPRMTNSIPADMLSRHIAIMAMSIIAIVIDVTAAYFSRRLVFSR